MAVTKTIYDLLENELSFWLSESLFVLYVVKKIASSRVLHDYIKMQRCLKHF